MATSDDVRDFLEQDKALCSQALSNGRDVLLRAAETLRVAYLPLRQKSAHGQPRPNTGIERTCRTCGASFLGLAAGKTGERGIWDDWHWYCSVECAPSPT